MKKKSLAILLLIAMIITAFPVNIFASSEFSDMPNNWSTGALQNAVNNGLLNGANGKIMPEDNLIRAQMAAVVNRAFGATVKSNISNFTDVSQSSWYYDDMAKAVQMQTFQGDGNKLNPDSNITREEAFVVLARAFKLSGANSSVLTQFTDNELVSSWAKDGVASLVSAGYVNGSNGMLNPKHNISRAEFAQIMDNLVKGYIKEAGTYTEIPEGNIMINVADVTLKDVTVTGDLIIGDGVGDGDVTLDNVIVNGKTIIRGGGENSIRITGNSVIQNIMIARVDGIVRVFAEDGTEVGEVVIDGNDDVIIEGKIGTVTIVAADVKVWANNANVENIMISGFNSQVIVSADSTVDKVVLDSEQAKVEVLGEVKNIETTKQAENAEINVADGGKVKKIEVNSTGTKIEGKGTVDSVEANADNVIINTKDTEVTVKKGVYGVELNGKEVKFEEENKGGGSGGGGGGGTTPDSDPDPAVSAINETVTIGIGEAYNLADNLEISPSDATVTYTSNDDAKVYSSLVAGKLTGIKQGRVTITAVASKEGYISKTISYEVLVAPVLLEWTTPTTVEKNAGEQETIVIDMSLLAGAKTSVGVDIIMEWHKKVESSSDWQVIDAKDIILKDVNNVPKEIESGFYRLVKGITIDSDNPSITSSVTFNNAGEYKLTVYAIKE